MRNNGVLVTAVGGDIGQSIIKCLRGSAFNFIIIGCDMDRYAAGRGDADKFLIAPPVADFSRYFTFVKRTIRRYGVKYIYPTSEPEIMFFDKQRSYFDRLGVSVFINRRNILETFFDKYKTIEFLKANQLPYPRTCLIDNYDAGIGYPCIIKPRHGCSSRGVILVRDKDELDFYKKRFSGYIVQEYLDGEDSEYTIGVFSDSRAVHSITFKRMLGFGGVSKIAQLAADREADFLAVGVAKSCGLVGSINIQARKTKKGLVPFEVNPRFSSTVYFRHYFGFKDVEWWTNVMEKKKIKYVLKYKTGVCVRKFDEVFFELKNK